MEAADHRTDLQAGWRDSGLLRSQRLRGLHVSMLKDIGHVEAIFRYPVDLLLFAPHRREDGAPGDLPTHVRTPDGETMPILGEALAAEVGRRYGAPVQMMQLNHGIFDEASLSMIAVDTVREIGRLAGHRPDVRRFRPNVVVRSLRSVPFQEDEWLGGVLSFGEEHDAPAIAVTMRDVRCSMVNLDPDSARPAPEVLRAVVRVNQNNAGIYGTVTRIARLAVGQTIRLHAGVRLTVDGWRTSRQNTEIALQPISAGRD